MTKFWKILVAVAFSALIFFLQFVSKEFLPYPFDQINVIFVAMVWLIILSSRLEIIWLGAPLAFLLEIFSSAPFGLNSFVLLLSFLLVYWLLANFLTNRSFLIVLLLGLIGMTFYRLVFIAVEQLFGLTSGTNWTWSGALSLYALEVVLTAVALTLFYLLTSLFVKKLNPSYVNVTRL